MPKLLSLSLDGLLHKIAKQCALDSLKFQLKPIFLRLSNDEKFEKHWELANQLVDANEEIAALKAKLERAESAWDVAEKNRYANLEGWQKAQAELEETQTDLRILRNDFLNASQCLARGEISRQQLQDALTEANRVNDQHFERHTRLNRRNDELSAQNSILTTALSSCVRLAPNDKGIQQTVHFALKEASFVPTESPEYIGVDFGFEMECSSDMQVEALYCDGHKFYPCEPVWFKHDMRHN